MALYRIHPECRTAYNNGIKCRYYWPTTGNGLCAVHLADEPKSGMVAAAEYLGTLITPMNERNELS